MRSNTLYAGRLAGRANSALGAWIDARSCLAVPATIACANSNHVHSASVSHMIRPAGAVLEEREAALVEVLCTVVRPR